MGKIYANADQTNLGRYPTSLFSGGYLHTLDKSLYTRIVEHVDSITDSLYIPLLSGVRIPAYVPVCLTYDLSSNSWDVPFGFGFDTDFVTGITPKMDATNGYISLDVTFNSDFVLKSDQTPLLFVSNASLGVTKNLFPVINDITHTDSSIMWCSIGLMSVDSSTITRYTPPDGKYGEFGLKIYLESLFQSNVDHTDRLFYNPSEPYFETDTLYASSHRFRILGYTYTNLDADYTHVLWATKTRFKAQAWTTNDATTGIGYGDIFYSAWDAIYTSAIHEKIIEELNPNTFYRLWHQIDSKTGPDSMDWSSYGVYKTNTLGGGRGDDVYES